MTLPLFVIRAEPGCGATVTRARALSLPASGFPLSAIAHREWQAPPASSVDALLVGSANVFRHGGAGLAALRSVPVYAVGEITARAARAAGFAVAAAGTGGLQAVLSEVPRAARLLRLAGDEHVPLGVPAGVTMDTRVVYAATPVALPPALADVLRGAAVVLLHSGAGARHFADECDRLGLSRNGIALAALGPRILAAAGGGWRAARAAHEPSEAALLALAGDLCHELARPEGA
ncbi:MAG: uroporphyrinogen-III synthase [Croceibacterium sp.]